LGTAARHDVTALQIGAARKRFGRDRRLLIPKEFKAVLDFRCSARAGAFLLHALPRQDASGPRLGMIVAKRVFKRAIDRNRARRVIREAFRLNQHDLFSQDYVVRVTGKFSEDTQAVRLELSGLLKKLERCQRKGQQINEPANADKPVLPPSRTE
jgi:ribonuclease P protein component